MNLLLSIKRPFIWLSRFRYRCGYGVHSPFAFSLITDVIYEYTPYYAYHATVIEVGQPSTASLYLQSAKPSASYLFASDLSELFLDADTPVDFLYMNNYQNPELMEEVFHICAQRVTLKSVFVVQGICYSKKMKTLWNQLKEDERVGVTFDLYDLGLLFFDKTKIKQHYIVNF